MNIEMEGKIVIHINDGYSATLTIGDNPDAPEVGFRLIYEEEKQRIVDVTFQDELLPVLIKGLNKYLTIKKDNK